MNKLANKFNEQLSKIAVSEIRAFDDKVSGIEGLVKLTIGEPDFDTPEHIKQAGIKAIEENYSHYGGMRGLIDARVAVSEFFEKKYNTKYNPETEILITVGATEAIMATLLSILNLGDKVLLPTPAYPGYHPIFTFAKAEAVEIDTTENGFVLSPEMIDKAMAEHGDKVKAIILNYPCNPTGVTYKREEIKAIADTLKKYDIFVISDEIYSELTYGEPHVSIGEYLPEQTIIITGLSKSHAMTGWRIGFIMAPEVLVTQLIKIHQYMVVSPTTISQRATIAAMKDGFNDAALMREDYRKRRDFVFNKLIELGFEVARPDGAFYIFAKIPANCIQNSMEFCVDLAFKNKVGVIPGSAFGASGQGYIRISYAASMQMLEIALKRIADYVNS
jgi:Aspartate/tyrosine/aromatic aminotransferase